MKSRETTVTLYADRIGERAFSFEHAERILKSSTKWVLPAGSRYEFTKENGLNKRRSSKPIPATEKEA